MMQQIETEGLQAGPRINSQTQFNGGHDSVIELAGVIKWFDAVKGYGFSFNPAARSRMPWRC